MSFTYDRQLYLQHGELADPALLTDAVKLDRGTSSGSCYLTCHGKNHNPLSYP